MNEQQIQTTSSNEEQAAFVARHDSGAAISWHAPNRRDAPLFLI